MKTLAAQFYIRVEQITAAGYTVNNIQLHDNVSGCKVQLVQHLCIISVIDLHSRLT